MLIAIAPRFFWGVGPVWRLFANPGLTDEVGCNPLACVSAGDRLIALETVRTGVEKLLRKHGRPAAEFAVAEVSAEGRGKGAITMWSACGQWDTHDSPGQTFTVTMAPPVTVWGYPHKLPRFYTMRSETSVQHIAVEVKELVFRFDGSADDDIRGGLMFSRAGVRHWGSYYWWVSGRAPEQYELCSIEEKKWLGGIDAVRRHSSGKIRSPALITLADSIPKTLQLFLFWLVAEKEAVLYCRYISTD
jgi:hypothetical protein